MRSQSLVEAQTFRPDPTAQRRVLLVVEHSLGPIHQVAEVEVELLVLPAKTFGLAAELRRYINGVLEISVCLFERKMQRELIAKLRQLVDELPAMAGGDGPLAPV